MKKLLIFLKEHKLKTNYLPIIYLLISGWKTHTAKKNYGQEKTTKKDRQQIADN